MGMDDPGCMQKTVRYAFLGFNVLFTIFGLGLVIAGSYGVAKAETVDIHDFAELIGTSKHEELMNNKSATKSALVGVSAVIIVIGLVTMCISSCGWIGACKQNTCLLFVFSATMVVIVLLEFILGITVLVAVKKFVNPNDESGAGWAKELISVAETAYRENTTAITDVWDKVQEEGHCCGIHGTAGEWKDKPASCKNYKEGCLEAYKDDLMHIASSSGGVAVGFCVIEIFGIIISCYLACTIRKGSQYEQH